jgi:ABC-2 type transport system ATP-binding protein
MVNGEPTLGGVLFATPSLTGLTIPIPSKPGTVLGPPRVRLVERGTGSGIGDPQRAPVYFQVVNTTKGEVAGNQVTPKMVATDGLTHTYEFDLEPLAYTLGASDQVALQVIPTPVGYGLYRGVAAVDIERVDVQLPLVSTTGA